MAAFQEIFHAIDEDNTGVITIEDLRNYMHKKRYKAKFVTTWTKLFDPDNTGFITFEKYCEVLGLRPARPKAAESSDGSEPRKLETPDSTETKPSTSECIQGMPIQQELASNVEAGRSSPDKSAERQETTEFVGQEGKEVKDSAETEPLEHKEENLPESPRPQSRKRKHSKSPSQKDSLQVESTVPTVESQPNVPVQETPIPNMDVFDWLNSSSQQEVIFEDDNMNGDGHLVESGVPHNEDPASMKELSTSSTKSTEFKSDQPSDKTKTDEAGIEGFPAALSAETDKAPPVEQANKKELNKRGKKTSESNKRKKKPSESSKVSEAEIAPSAGNVEESVISSLEHLKLEKGQESEELTVDPSELGEKRPASGASSRSAKSPAGNKGVGKKKHEKKTSKSAESKRTHQSTEGSEIKAPVEQPIEIAPTLKPAMQDDHDKESLEPPAMDKTQSSDIEMGISASTVSAVESAVPFLEGSERPSEPLLPSQESSVAMDVPTSATQKHKSPVPKSRRKKRSSKSGYSESSNSERREKKTSPKSSPDKADDERHKPRAKSISTTLPEELEGLHIVKRHPMQIIPSPGNVPGLEVPSVKKLESTSLEQPQEANQEGMDVEQAERSDEQHAFNIEVEQTEPTLESMGARAAPENHPESADDSMHVVGDQPEPIVPELIHVQESAVPPIERAEPCSLEKPLEAEQEKMDIETTQLQGFSPPSAGLFGELRPTVVEVEQSAPASDSMQPEAVPVASSEPVSKSMHIVKKHPMHIIASPINVAGVAASPLEKEEPHSPEKPVEQSQEAMNVEVACGQSSSPHPEPSAPPMDVSNSETASADLLESVTESLHIGKKHPMQIIPPPSNAPESDVPSAPEEKTEGEMEATPTAMEPQQTSKDKQRPPKSGKKPSNSADKKRGKKSPKVLSPDQEAVPAVTDPQISLFSPAERLEDESLTPTKEREENQPVVAEVDVAPSMAEVVDFANLSTEQPEPSGKKSPNSSDKKRNKESPVPSKKKPREKKTSETEAKAALSPAMDAAETTSTSVEEPEPSGIKSSSSSDKKRTKKSPVPFGEGKEMQSSVDVIKASGEGQKSPTEKHAGRDSPTKKGREKKSSESAEAEEKQPTDIEMEVLASTADVVGQLNPPAEHHEPSEKTPPSSSAEKDIETSPKLSPEHEEASFSANFDVIQVRNVRKSPDVSSRKSGGKDKSSKKRPEKKPSESTKLEEQDPTTVESTAAPMKTTMFEHEPENLENQEPAKSGKKSPAISKKRGKKASESSPEQRKSPLVSDMDVQESSMEPANCPDDRIETSAKKNEEETLEVGKADAEKPIDIEMASPPSSLSFAEPAVPTEKHQENIMPEKDKKRGKKPSESSPAAQKATAEPAEALDSSVMPSEHSNGRDAISKQKGAKKSKGSRRDGEEQSKNVEVETTSATLESPAPPIVHPESPKPGKKAPTKQTTEATQERKSPKTEPSETPTKQKASKSQRPGASKTPKEQAAKAAKDVTTLESPEVDTPPTTSDLPRQSGELKSGKRRRGTKTKADEEAESKESEKSTPPKDSGANDVKKPANKKRKIAEVPNDNAKRPSGKGEKTKKVDNNKPKKPERCKRPKEEDKGAEKSPVKKSKRPRVGHLECGRFPRAFPTQVGHRVRQHRRDGAPVSTYALGKAPKGTRTKTSIARRRRNKPSKAVQRWKLRSSLRRIGTIVILLAGRHRGKRAVVVGRHRFSGLLLVTGPFKCNGIPVRRVHPDYVIATKTRIKISKLHIPSRMQTKEYFARQKPPPRSKNAADNLFVDSAAGKKAYELKEERKEDQKLIDKCVIKAIKRSKQAKMLFAYLRSQFALSRHDMPHKMVF